GPARTACAPLRQYRLGDLERRIAPAELGTGAAHFLRAERRAVRGRLTGLGRRAVADHGLAGDQRRPVGPARLLQRNGDGFRIVTVDPHRRPAGGGEALELIVGGGERGGAVDGD